MTLSLTCHRCGTVLSADTEQRLAEMGENHAREHGHTRRLSRQHVLARIRRHNPDGPASATT